MSEKNITAWFLEGGFTAMPKKLFAFMEPLGMDWEDLGVLSYLFYCDFKISDADGFVSGGLNRLAAKGLIVYDNQEKVSISPMVDRIYAMLSREPLYVAGEEEPEVREKINFALLLKEIEKELGVFVSEKDKMEIMKASQSFGWPMDFLRSLYVEYQKKARRRYSFGFFVNMVREKGIEDAAGLDDFIGQLDYVIIKIQEIKKRLGLRGYPSEIEKECYFRWTNEMKFSHEVIMLAAEQTKFSRSPSFGYLESILENWHVKGLKTAEAVEADNRMWKENRKKNSGRKKAPEAENVYGYTRSIEDLYE